MLFYYTNESKLIAEDEEGEGGRVVWREDILHVNCK